MIGLVRRVAAVLGIAALPLMTGCAGFWVAVDNSSSSGTTSSDIVYVANVSAESVAGFTVGTGTLTAVTGSPYSLGLVPTALVVNPANSLLFVAASSEIFAYAISSDGSLSVLNSGSAVGSATLGVASMAISPDGQWLFVLDGDGTTVDEFLIDSSTGTLSQVTGASYIVTSGTVLPTSIAVSPNGELVFVSLGNGGDLVFTFDTSTGVMASSQTLNPISSTTSDNDLAVSPDSAYLYIARSGTNGGLAVYSIGTNGALTPVSGSPFTAGSKPVSVVVNHAGTDVYVANYAGSDIYGFSVGSSGALTALSGSPYSSGTSVIALGIDNSTDYLLAAASGGSPDLTMYSFDSTTPGKLDTVAVTATGSDPTTPVALALTH